MTDALVHLAERVQRGERQAIARALNLVEDQRRRADAGVLLSALGRRVPKAKGHRVGLTGPPGVGKSSLAAALARSLVAQGRRVGIVAIDPTSPRSGGSLLGDRARLGSQDAVFMRSLATGGQPGGLSDPVHASVAVLGAAFDLVLIETTGVGQTETDVEQVADTVALVIQPGSGDALQFLKAGIMEIPDILVVNKADHRELADRAMSDLRGAALSATGVTTAHARPTLATSALHGDGVDALIAAFDQHRSALGDAGLLRSRRAGALAWTRGLFRRAYGTFGVATLEAGGVLLDEAIRSELDDGRSPLEAVTRLEGRFLEVLRRS